MLPVVNDLHILYISQIFSHERKLNSSLRKDIFLFLNENMLSKASNTYNTSSLFENTIFKSIIYSNSLH